MCKISRKTSPKVWFGWYWRPVHSRFWTFQNCRCQWRCENFLCRISNTTAQTWIILSKTILWYWKLNKNFLLYKMKYPYNWKDFWSDIYVLRFIKKKVNKLSCKSSLRISLRVQNLLFAVTRKFTRHYLYKRGGWVTFGYFIQLNSVQILVNYIVVLRLFITSIDVLD